MKRPLVAILCLALFAPSGCTVIGFGVGLATPDSAEVEGLAVVKLEPGTEVAIEMVSAQRKITIVRGTFVAASGDFIVVEAEEGRYELDRRWVRRVTVNAGSKWVSGTLTGAIIDAGVLLLVGLISAQNSRVFR